MMKKGAEMQKLHISIRLIEMDTFAGPHLNFISSAKNRQIKIHIAWGHILFSVFEKGSNEWQIHDP